MQIRFLSSFLRLLAIGITSFAANIAQAQIPQTLNYQGYLTDSFSKPVNAAVSVTFRIYTAASGGAPVWSETQPGIGVINGIYNAVLGSVTPLALPFNVPYFLSLQVNSDAEMSGRQPLSAVPYALRALSADAVAASATIPATQLTGTLASGQFAATQLLPISPCAANQSPQWNGSAWTCASGTTGAQGPVGPAGPIGPQGPAGSIDAVTNLTLPISTPTQGNILKGNTPFIHNFGSLNTFIGEGAGNFSMNGSSNTGSGTNALGVNTSGDANTASGTNALFSNTTGTLNTASGANALQKNTTGSNNTAIGGAALLNNISANDNTALGTQALVTNTTGGGNTATGKSALQNNTYGDGNTANGANALRANITGFYNTASGINALVSNTTGDRNTASGYRILEQNTNGNGNTAMGYLALLTNRSGSGNIAIGAGAGGGIIAGNNNISIGSGSVGLDESGTIRIGDQINQIRTFIGGIRNTTTGSASAIPVLIDNNGQLGTFSSSRRYKDNIADMDSASSALMQLRPVTFHYKSDQDPAGRALQYGLIAEEVAEIYPGLVAHSADGQIETVMYQHLPPMLLNEAQKQHRAIESLRAQLLSKDHEIDNLKRDLDAMKKKLGLD